MTRNREATLAQPTSADQVVVPREDVERVRKGLTLAYTLSCDVPITAVARRELDDAFSALERLASAPSHEHTNERF